MSQELFKYRMFFANDSYNDDPQYEIPVKTIHEQKEAEYRRAYDAQDVDNSDLSVINATNDYSVSIYPWISPLYKSYLSYFNLFCFWNFFLFFFFRNIYF